MEETKIKAPKTTIIETQNNEVNVEGFVEAIALAKSTKDSTYYKTTRELTKQTLRPVRRDGDLFNSNILSSEAKKYALMLKANKGMADAMELLSEIGDGLNCGHTGRLVVEALCETLYEQSLAAGTEQELLGYTQKIASKTGFPVLFDNHSSTGTSDNHKSMFTYIPTRTVDIAKKIYGNKKISGKEKELVSNALTKLAKSEFPIVRKNRKTIFVPLVVIEARGIDEDTGAESFLLRLSPIFTSEAKNNFIGKRKDYLQILRLCKTGIARKLLDKLTLAMSFKSHNNENWPMYIIRKDILLDNIAVGGEYIEHKSRINKDYDKAVTILKENTVIFDYKESNDYGDGYLYCIFDCNPDFIK